MNYIGVPFRYANLFFLKHEFGGSRSTEVCRIKKASDTVNVVGEEVKKHIREHGLRLSYTTSFFEDGFKFHVVARNSGYRDPRSALCYQSTECVHGQKLKANMFG